MLLLGNIVAAAVVAAVGVSKPFCRCRGCCCRGCCCRCRGCSCRGCFCCCRGCCSGIEVPWLHSTVVAAAVVAAAVLLLPLLWLDGELECRYLLLRNRDCFSNCKVGKNTWYRSRGCCYRGCCVPFAICRGLLLPWLLLPTSCCRKYDRCRLAIPNAVVAVGLLLLTNNCRSSICKFRCQYCPFCTIPATGYGKVALSCLQSENI